MNKNVKFLTVGLAAFVVGLSVNNLAMSDVPANYKIAMVDVQQVLSNSSQIKNLQKDQIAKTEELVKFVEKARKDVASVSDEKKKKAMEDKYTKELQAKKDKITKDKEAKLSAIDSGISKVIETQAKAGNYDVVLLKGVVLYGGDDVTAKVISSVE